MSLVAPVKLAVFALISAVWKLLAVTFRSRFCFASLADSLIRPATAPLTSCPAALESCDRSEASIAISPLARVDVRLTEISPSTRAPRPVAVRSVSSRSSPARRNPPSNVTGPNRDPSAAKFSTPSGASPNVALWVISTLPSGSVSNSNPVNAASPFSVGADSAPDRTPLALIAPSAFTS